MAKNKASKPRNKKYVPKYEGKLPMTFKMTPKELKELKDLTISAITCLRQGVGSIYAWCDVTWRLVVGRELAVKFFHEEEAAELFHNAIVRALNVYEQCGHNPEGQWQISAEDAAAFTEATDLADDMLPQLTRREYAQVYEPFTKMPINVLRKQNMSWENYKKEFIKAA